MYRIIGVSGHYDKKSNNQDILIKEASTHKGVFTLWAWNGRQWIKQETFIF